MEKSKEKTRNRNRKYKKTGRDSKKFKEKNMDAKFIAEVTGLTEEEIEKIK